MSAAGPNRTATDPFSRFLNYVKEADQVVRFYIEGLETISRSRIPESSIFAKFLASRDPDDATVKLFSGMERRAEEAQVELDTGTPLILAHTVVGTWGAFESAFFDSIVAWLIVRPATLQSEAIDRARKKIPDAEWDELDEIGRMRLLRDKLYAPLRNGVPMMDRLVTLLDLVGLSGPVDESTKQTLHEMYLVRNLIAHQASRVDRQFADACPHLGYAVGERLTVKRSDWLRYELALIEFCMMISKRFSAQFPELPAALLAAGGPTDIA